MPGRPRRKLAETIAAVEDRIARGVSVAEEADAKKEKARQLQEQRQKQREAERWQGFPVEVNIARKAIALNLEDFVNNLIILANGVTVEERPWGSTEKRVYTRPPDKEANIYLIDRIMGKVRPERDNIADRLNKARAMYIEQQIATGLIEAQVKDLSARGERAQMEVRMWPQQFVTEDEQERQLRDMVAAVNKNLVNMTPEEFAAIAPGVVDPGLALEKLRGKIGREQAEVLREVMEGGREQADEDDGTEEDAEGDEE